MKAVVQRVKSAVIDIDDNGNISREEIGQGLVILLGIYTTDTEQNMKQLAERCRGMRIFTDENDKMNLSVNDIGGEVLIVSNFTLCADTSHGKRPSFIAAARPEQAKPLYDQFIEIFKTHTPVKTGVFGADMKIDLVNDGPITLIVEG
ncbi:MAG: D-tyrosyl-tRNA(Tyr) deacylase [Clostridia bacterium]|nr:D-tyrosyl-tRNA(Tyr) deacylase [Clostridia bacterium]MBO5298763.1 D-tyrosyl-tRNA(Tyr) deacylase [Clostridia bacterium]